MSIGRAPDAGGTPSGSSWGCGGPSNKAAGLGCDNHPKTNNEFAEIFKIEIVLMNIKSFQIFLIFIHVTLEFFRFFRIQFMTCEFTF